MLTPTSQSSESERIITRYGSSTISVTVVFAVRSLDVTVVVPEFEV